MLDIGLPDIDGFEVCRRIRARSTVPIVMLTARDEEPDRVAGLELGADDYVPKPFSPRELVARVKAILRRAEAATQAETLELDGVVLHRDAHDVEVDGDEVELTAKEFDLLAFLLENPGIVHSRERLLDRVWGLTYPGRHAHRRRPRRAAAAQARPAGADPHGAGRGLQGGRSEALARRVAAGAAASRRSGSSSSSPSASRSPSGSCSRAARSSTRSLDEVTHQADLLAERRARRARSCCSHDLQPVPQPRARARDLRAARSASPYLCRQQREPLRARAGRRRARSHVDGDAVLRRRAPGERHVVVLLRAASRSARLARRTSRGC